MTEGSIRSTLFAQVDPSLAATNAHLGHRNSSYGSRGQHPSRTNLDRPGTKKYSELNLLRWLLIIGGVGAVSWALLTADLSRNTRAIVSLTGGVVLVFGLSPDRTHRAHPSTDEPED